MPDDLTGRDGDVLRCCDVDLRRIGAAVRLAQHARRLLKATIWHGLTAALDRVGLTLSTVQILCIDRTRGLVLVLRTDEYPSGYCPVQGLRKQRGPLPLFGSDAADVREDARRELGEEATLAPPSLARFRIALKYREGPYRQFDCTVLVVDCEAAELELRPETAEGIACWSPVAEVVGVLNNPVLSRVLTAEMPASHA
jgi:8-oxo-dGTP pyrophosphatase MutT (NUDIX family)